MKDKADLYLAAYDRVLEIFKVSNDNYFKRTQIVGLFIQSALFAASIKIAWDKDLELNCSKEWLLLAISVMGMLSAFYWFKSIIKQGDYLELCRLSMRDIECCLSQPEHDIPLEYFTKESKVFHDKTGVSFNHAGLQFPREKDHKERGLLFPHKVKGGLIKLDKSVPLFLIALWGICFLIVAFVRDFPKGDKMFTDIVITDIFIAAAAVLQVIFAGVLLIYIKKQKDIMNAQNELTQQIDESNKAGMMRAKYADLRDMRKRFWDQAPRIYSDLRKYVEERSGVECPESFEEAIDNAGFPPGFNPAKVTNLFYSVETLEPKWSNTPLWHFMTFLYPNDEDDKKNKLISSSFIDDVYECRAQLAYFWDDWSYQLKELGKYVQPNPRELVALTWFEFALIRQVEDTAARAGKVHLFRFAKTQWNEFVKEQREV